MTGMQTLHKIAPILRSDRYKNATQKRLIMVLGMRTKPPLECYSNGGFVVIQYLLFQQSLRNWRNWGRKDEGKGLTITNTV
jgi:hypothetical protein